MKREDEGGGEPRRRRPDRDSPDNRRPGARPPRSGSSEDGGYRGRGTGRTGDSRYGDGPRQGYDRGGGGRPRGEGGYRGRGTGRTGGSRYGDGPRQGYDRGGGDRPRGEGGYRGRGVGGTDRPRYGDGPRQGYDRGVGGRPRGEGGYRGRGVGGTDRSRYGDGPRQGYDKRGGDRDRQGGYRGRGAGAPDRPRRPRDDEGGRGGGYGERRPPRRRFEEPGIGDDEGAFSSSDSRSLGRAATTGRNLWTPRPRQARRPGAPAGKTAGPRRSTNTVGGEQVEGRQAVRELLAGSRTVNEVFLVEGNDPAPILGEIDNLARERNVPVRMVSPRRLESVQRTETPQGVVAFAEPLRGVDLSDLVLEGKEEGRPAAFLVVLDGVTDPHNLGAVLRSAECAGATGAVLPRHRAVHVTAAVTKAAAGAVEHLKIALVPGVPSALQSLSELGVQTIGLDEKGDSSIFDLSLGNEPVALVLGAEGRGLSPLTRRRCDVLARIPLHGELSSLNVSTAAAVACFEVARGRS